MISNADPATRTGDCSVCGAGVPVLRHHGWRCATRQPRNRAAQGRGDQRGQWLRARLRRYGLTAEQHQAMIDAHGGRCALCQRDRPLHIDHDHTSGRVRGLLCLQCNTTLGWVERIGAEAIVDYLK